MKTWIASGAALAAALSCAAYAEDLAKDGLTTSGVKLTYEATALPDGRLQIDLTLECREKKLEAIHGVGVAAVVSKLAGSTLVERGSLTCTVTGGQDRVTVSKKTTSKIIVSGATPADIGKTVFVLGKANAGGSPKMDGPMKKLNAALDEDIAKLSGPA